MCMSSLSHAAEKGCRCQVGERHGPYYYVRRRTNNGKYKDVYVKSMSVGFVLKHEKVGETDLLVSIDRPSELPEMFGNCPMFVVTRRFSSERVEDHLEPS